jgi:hypothetical protein
VDIYVKINNKIHTTIRRPYMKTKNKSLIATTITAFLLTIAIVSNYNSLEYAKEACVGNNKTPVVDQNLLALNWSVSCK